MIVVADTTRKTKRLLKLPSPFLNLTSLILYLFFQINVVNTIYKSYICNIINNSNLL